MKFFTLKNNKSSKKIIRNNQTLSIFNLSTKLDWNIMLVFSSVLLISSLIFLANFYFNIKKDLELVESEVIEKKLTIDEKRLDSVLEDLLDRRNIKFVIPVSGTSTATTTIGQSIDDI